MKKKNCFSCMHWKPDLETDFEPGDKNLEKNMPGECRKNSPDAGYHVKHSDGDEESWSANWPRTMADEWCSEFAISTAKKSDAIRKNHKKDMVISYLTNCPDGATMYEIRESLRMSGERIRIILAELCFEGVIESCELVKPNGTRCEGYRLAGETNEGQDDPLVDSN